MRNVALSTVLGAVVGFGAVAFAQTQTTQGQQTQTSSSQGSQTGPGRASAWGQASSTASGSGSASSSKSGFGQGGGSQFASGGQRGSASGFASGRDVSHAVMFESNKDGDTVTDRMLQERQAYYSNLARMGKVALSGPWTEKNGGLTLLFVKTDQEAAQIAMQDPAVRANVWTYRVRRWTVDVVGTPAAPVASQAGVAAQRARQSTPPPR